MRERGKIKTTYAGQLLLAHPALRDPNFRRAVILMSVHDPDGAVGVVLNRPLGRQLAELNPEFAVSTLAGVPVYQGGPVETEKLILVSWRRDSVQMEFQLNFGLDVEQAVDLVGTPGVTVRAFLGYSGWGKGQLEKEMKQQTWITVPVVDYNLTAEEGAGLWKLIVGSLDPELKLMADEPEDPTLN
jgi:putative transcriptional regulator